MKIKYFPYYYACSAVAVCILAAAAAMADKPDTEAQRLYHQARLHMKAGQYGEALAKATAVVGSAPGFIEAHHLRQDARIALGDRGKLIAEETEQLKNNPGGAQAHYLLGRITESLEEKERLFKRAAELDPVFPWPRYGLGHLYERLGRWEESEEAFKKSVELAPAEPEFRQGLGFCYMQQGKDDMAREAFNSALKRDPSFVDALINLAIIDIRAGDYAAAEAACLKALEIDKDNPWAHNNLGKAYFHQRRLAAALRHFQAALADPSYDTPEIAYLNMGFVYRARNLPEQAEAAFRRALEIEPEFAYAHVMLAYVLYDRRRYEEAWKSVDRAREMGYPVSANFLEALSKASPRKEE